MGWFADVVDAVRSRVRRARLEPPPPGQYASLDALLARMRELDRQLPADDGVRAFNGMYLRVTELVRDRLSETYFGNPAFMTRLDLVFAGLYLDAVAAPEQSKEQSKAWAPLFEARQLPGRVPIQFALAGMNAHINHDLPVAVVRTCRQLGLSPDGQGVEADFQRVTGLLASVQEEGRQSFLTGPLLEVDEAYAGPLADLVGAWSIGRARDAAWVNARVLWELHGVEPLQAEFLATLSRSVGMAGRYLLTPVAQLA
jgi:hypothetical protein